MTACSVVRASGNSSHRDAESLQVASNGRPAASIVVPSGVPVPYAATELKKYLRALSGADFEIITDTQIASRPAGEAVILLGGPDTNKAVHEAVAAKWVSFTDLKPEGLSCRAAAWATVRRSLSAATTRRQLCMRPMNWWSASA